MPRRHSDRYFVRPKRANPAHSKTPSAPSRNNNSIIQATEADAVALLSPNYPRKRSVWSQPKHGAASLLAYLHRNICPARHTALDVHQLFYFRKGVANAKTSLGYLQKVSRLKITLALLSYCYFAERLCLVILQRCLPASLKTTCLCYLQPLFRII